MKRKYTKKEQSITITEKDFTNNKITTIRGFKKCPKWLKTKYRIAVKNTCQGCHKNEAEVGKLTPHRIKQGNCNGIYTLVPLNHPDNNVMMLCSKCHKMHHFNNYNWCKSR